MHQQIQSDPQSSAQASTSSISDFIPKSPPNPRWLSIEVDGDVVTRLHNLSLFGEEPDLSEELLMQNDQLQKDEVLAMESICGENIFILDSENGLRSFQIHIYIDTSEGLTISTKLNSSQNSQGISYSFDVNYIPPISLTCVLPKSYPTHLPPYFTISVQWLDSLKISSLCSKLDSIWKEQHGQEVIYSWADWMHTYAIYYLGFDKEIVLGPYDVTHQGDPRALSGRVSPDVDVPSLKSYNEEQRLENFLKTLQECCICFGEFAGSEFIRLPCQHFFCEKCLKTYADRLLGDEEFEKRESLTLQKTLESMPDVVYCPRCETPCIEDEDQDAQCSKCFFSFCTLCWEKRHVGVTCITPDIKLRILQERQKSSQMKDKQRQRELKMIDELVCVKEILRNAKQCPSCKMAISRIDGCNKMVCRNCGQYFCYRCNKAINGYDHFQEGIGELFPQEIEEWEEQMNLLQVIDQIQPELFVNDGVLWSDWEQQSHILLGMSRPLLLFVWKDGQARLTTLWSKGLQTTHGWIAMGSYGYREVTRIHSETFRHLPPLVRSTMRGGGRRGAKSHQNKVDENWSFKPLHDQQIQPSTSSSMSESIPTTPKSPPNHRKPRWVSRNRASGSQYVSNYEPKQGNKQDDSNKDKAESVVFQEEKKELSDSNKVVVEGEDDVMTRLEKLNLFGEEPDLSEELLTQNDQLQEDEVLAMESIYGENIFILDNYNGRRSFQIHIYIETQEELTISTKLNSTQNLNTDNSSSEGFSYSFQVKYLPPIILTCVLPKSYPSHLPPYFTISVQWLDSLKVSSLCSMLDLIWKEQHGQEVIYSWAEWLHTSAVSYLGFDEEIVLGLYGVEGQGDTRALSGCVSPDVDVPSLKSYNEEKRLENFLKTLQECCICFGEFAGAEFIRLPCQHFFCEKCIKTYAEVLIQEGTVNKLSCPTTKCGGMIPPGVLKRLLGDEEFEKWETLALQKTLESMSDVVYCPRCETPCIEDEGQDAQCSKCFFSFCTLCREKRHVGIMCITPEMKLRILQERQTSTQMKDKQRQREQEMIQELLSVKEIFRDAKQCPSCKMAISKTEGCNKMVCQNCGKYFCYRCNKVIDGYDHFRDGACELFPQEEIRIWEEMMNPRQALGQAQAELFGDRGHSCPQCGQINGKVGNNNHIFCWACQGHYCYLCGKMVRRGSQHFGPKGCKQHTVG
ncbi:hypothetical protein L1987_72327 [Smallanthus sonchifolius]|uniref:Uncharacterized protein n=1 Tax=Smallanthus sonchifolius TaxID=185202 RepID=A0ACB9AW90_9ASTR|nr:hypothetical protein L1987_72327 [Smallanthus sonchifolius]